MVRVNNQNKSILEKGSNDTYPIQLLPVRNHEGGIGILLVPLNKGLL